MDVAPEMRGGRPAWDFAGREDQVSERGNEMNKVAASRTLQKGKWLSRIVFLVLLTLAERNPAKETSVR